MREEKTDFVSRRVGPEDLRFLLAVFVSYMHISRRMLTFFVIPNDFKENKNKYQLFLVLYILL